MRPITALLGLAAIGLVPTSALAQRQPPTPEQRLDRLERQINQLQRQVFPKGRPAETAGFSDEPAATQSSVATLDQRLDSLERQMADLLRQSEESGHRLQTLEADVAKARTEQEQRLSTLEQRMNDAATAAAAQPAAAEPAAETKPVARKPVTSKPASSKPSAAEKGEGGPALPAASATLGAVVDPGEDAYTQGFHLWEAGRYDDAIAALKAFVAAYPKHRRVSYANNLIGRALLSKGDARNAAAVFLANYRANASGERAADSLYYLGQAVMQLGQPGQACKAYSEFDAIYGSKARADLKKQVAEAKAQAQCGRCANGLGMVPEPALVERFARDLDALIAPGVRIGIAVSGGPDSLALLLLAAAARPDKIEAASVDHALREGSREEAEMVASACARLGVPHAILTAEWDDKPATAIQERARDERYRLLAEWGGDRQLDAVATAHHLDDQAETLLMRLARGAGVRGLAGIRAVALVPGSDVPLLRPLLGWRRAELEQIVAAAGLEPARDPSNEDEHYERVRVRRALGQADWLDPQALAASAAHLGEAEAALEWAADQEWARAITDSATQIAYRPTDAPPEIRRRIVARAIARLATEGERSDLRGRELDRLLAQLEAGRTGTLRGVLCSGADEWRFVPAPNRTRPVDNLR